MLLVQKTQFNKAKLFDGCSFTMKDGSKLPSYKAPKCGYALKNLSPDTPIPDFSIIDFSVTPMRCCASVMLQCYVAAHVGYEDSKNREDLINLATKAHEYKKPMLEPEKVPMQIDAWSMQGVFLPSTGSNWQHDGYYVLLKQSTWKISDELFKSIFPRENENNRNRASKLLKSGAILHSTTQYKYCKSRLDSTLEIILFRVDCTPSVKTKVKNESNVTSKEEDYYTIFLAFNANTLEILFYPYSICGCYDGRHACSHVAAFMLLIRCIQRCEYNQELFENSFPANPIKLQNCITLIEHLGYLGENIISKRKKVAS